MIGKLPPGLFIAGTNTAVGKTFVACAIIRSLVARGRRVGVYKPALSGCQPAEFYSGEKYDKPPLETEALDDDVRLWLAAGKPLTLAEVCPQRFSAPLAPHRAAQAEGRTVDATLLRTGIKPWRENSEIVVVEGAGGLFSPLTFDELNADLAAELGYPLVLVTANVLGVIHSTLATLFAARAYRPELSIAAIVLNDAPGDQDQSGESNFQELEQRCAPCPVIRHGRDQQQVSAFSWLSD